MPDSTIDIEVLCWGPAKDLVGVESLSLTIPDGSTITDLREILCKRSSNLAPMISVIKMAVNESFVVDSYVLTNGDIVALIPPVSGGAPGETIWIDLIEELISTQRVCAHVAGDAANGAIVTFEGITRSEIDPVHGPLIELQYEAYDSMAKKQLNILATEAKETFGLGRVAVVHRIGAVPPAEISVAIAVSAPHRSEAFEGCRYLIDTLKKDVPIWKKDVFKDGFVRWVDPANKSSNS